MRQPAIRGAEVALREVTHLYQRQGEDVVALRDVHLHVHSGEAVALLGPSGSGKSTLLSLVAGLQQPTTGQVLIDGDVVAASNRRTARRLRKRTVGLLVQDPATMLPAFATPRQLLRLAGDPDPRTTLARYGLHAQVDQPVAQLSAGEQQRVALGVAMVRRPAVLLADEPTSRLDAAAKELVTAVLHEATQEAGTTVIAVTHDRRFAATFPRAVTMNHGRVGTDGSGDEQYAVVAPDGSLSLSREALELLPPGSRVRITPDAPRVQLSPVDEGTER